MTLPLEKGFIYAADLRSDQKTKIKYNQVVLCIENQVISRLEDSGGDVDQLRVRALREDVKLY